MAGRFTDRALEMAADAWDRPSPCEGWVGRDVVCHLVEWVPAVIGRAGLPVPDFPPVDDDPVGAWRTLDAWLQELLDDPEVAATTFQAGPPGEMSVEGAIDRLVTGDVLVHTWDLARTGGLDESLDEGLCAELLAGMAATDEALRASGHYGPKVEVPADADLVTRLIAFTGRTP